MHWLDVILISALIVAGYVISYLLLMRRVSRIVSERQLKIADQLAALDDAIRALETRLAEHHAASELVDAARNLNAAAEEDNEVRDSESESIAPDTQAVIAAAAVAALGQGIQIRAIKPATSSWSQQGRVLVQGSHNARARR
jgi:hypothetical protein